MPKRDFIGMTALRGEVCRILRSAAVKALAWKWRYLIAVVLIGVFLRFAVMPYDPVILSAVQFRECPTADALASALSRIGRTEGTTLVLVVVLLVAGITFRREHARRVGLCLLLAVVISGVGVNVLRPAFGRGRPFSDVPGEFCGPSLDHARNSFPSGHSSEAWTVATVISFEFPPAAVPACLYASSMMWARMQRNQHFPADVFGGMVWGVLCALPFVDFRGRKRN